MNELTKIWLLELLDKELKEVNGNIANGRLWLQGSTSVEDIAMFKENISTLEEYKDTLLNCRKQLEETGCICLM